MKCVMIIDNKLPSGIIANTTAALGISLASSIEGLTGADLTDREGRIHEGITNIPIPVLALEKNELKEKYDSLLESDDEDLKIIGFSDVAQKSSDYDDYGLTLKDKGKDDISYLGICIYGPRKKVNRITGSLKMLR